MRGRIVGREALVDVSIRTAGGDVQIEFVIDTGFTDSIALPPLVVERLGLALVSTNRAELANGTEVEVDVHDAVILWQGYEVEVPVMATGRRALIGTALLAGWELRAQFVRDGIVSVSGIG